MVKEGIDALFGILSSQVFPCLRPLTIFKYINSYCKREGNGLGKKRASCEEDTMDSKQRKCRKKNVEKNPTFQE